MKPERQETTKVLIDISYRENINHFEEIYGENITYREIEQHNYLAFKEEIFEKINQNIKIRKFGRIGYVLTIKADMMKKEIERFKRLIHKDQFIFSSDWSVKEVTVIKK